LFRGGANGPWGLDGGDYWRLSTYALLHGGLLHLVMNTWVLVQLGPAIERRFATARFVAIYLAAALLGGLASAIFGAGISVGASAGLFGVMGAGILAAHRAGTSQAIQLRNQLLFWSGLILVIGFAGARVGGAGFDNAAHLGGLVGGLVLTFVIDRVERRQGRARNVSAVENVLATVAFVVFACAPLVVQVVVRDVPADRPGTERAVFAAARPLWETCRDSLANGIDRDDVPACRSFRLVLYDRAAPYLLYGAMYEAMGDERAVAREARLFERLFGEPPEPLLLPADVAVPLFVEQIDAMLAPR
jgi:membrane associated rhomboid family serine protease